MKTTTIKQESLNSDDSAINQQSLNADSSTNSLSNIGLDRLDDTEFDLERIMLEEFAKGLPSDIPMADF
ncbi:hypothetical protein H6G14_23905 [Nostoc parmelioides FACHB-3921]|uniref:Uncharacterized protein n=1 Tax=Nostoc parmelioides FACHB-3921 TaxID=2692909 RepID=A0ABR8BJN3_9NOSO|nr:hypothetical protein [Nostoc parmelioides FACHB-3921]